MIGLPPAGRPEATVAQVVTGTIISAVITGLAVLIAVESGLKVWIVLIGLLAYSSHGHGLGAAAANYLCLGLGLVLGIVSALLTPVLQASLGVLGVPVVVTIVTCFILPLRRLPVINNLICYVLGLIAVIGSGEAPGVAVFLSLAATTAIGTIAGWAAESMQTRIVAPA